jgi:hypothetical protein
MSNFSGFEMESKYQQWDPGWYAGAIVPEYETTGTFAKVIKTEDVVSTNGDSRNLKLAVVLVNGNKTDNKSVTYNYRTEALSDDRKNYLREAKKSGAQLGGSDFRDFMSLSRLNDLEKAGLTLEINGHGGFDTSKLVGTTADFYLSIQKFTDETKKNSRAVTKEEMKSADEDERKSWFGKITQIAKVDTKRK